MFSRQDLRDFRAKFEAELKTLSDKFGVDLTIDHKATYGETMQLKIVAASKRTDGKPPETEMERAFKANAALFGLKAEDLGRSFTQRGMTFIIAGMNPRAYKTPILAKNLNGKMYRFPVETVKTLMTPRTEKVVLTQSDIGTLKVSDLNLNKKRPDADIISDILDVDCALSPENLSCDGEASMTYIHKEGARLRTKRATFVKELGREPTHEELWGKR